MMIYLLHREEALLEEIQNLIESESCSLFQYRQFVMNKNSTTMGLFLIKMSLRGAEKIN